MSSQAGHPRALDRVPTGVAGLDLILGGGLLRGGIYALVGAPGVGKTTLGNQICFDHVRRGGRAVYLTLLAESHGRMVLHMQPFAFFDPARLGQSLHYISGYPALESEGLEGLVGLVRRLVREHHASLLVLDGLRTAEAFADSGLQFKRFVHDLQAHLQVLGCTSLLLTDQETGASPPVQTMVDGVIELRHHLAAPRALREVQVRKLRGSGFVEGLHSFAIDGRGLTVWPRLEAGPTGRSDEPPPSRQRLGFGVAGLDEMLGGGVAVGSSTLLLGPPGSGKTLLGLHFLAAGDEPGLWVGLREPPSWLLDRAAAVGIDLAGPVTGGRIELIWPGPGEPDVDALAHRILDAVGCRAVRRLFVDDLAALLESAVYPERVGRLFAALTGELRRRGAASVFGLSVGLVGDRLDRPLDGLPGLVDTLICLRREEPADGPLRAVWVAKARGGGHDQRARGYAIGPRGFELAAR